MGIKNKLLDGADTYGVQKFLMLTNLFDFCVLPRVTVGTNSFFHAFMRHHNVDLDRLDEMHDIDKQLAKQYFYAEKERIPLKMHRVWVTDPD